jgi:two-component system phosphate regulon response regulator PhoB
LRPISERRTVPQEVPEGEEAVLRSVLYRFTALGELERALAEGSWERSWELELPDGVAVADGEWVLATFEVEGADAGTATPARGEEREGGVRLVFDKRDCDRLLAFARSGAPPSSEEEASDTLRPAPPSAFMPKERTALLVDEDEAMRDVVGAMLESVGLGVDAVPSAEEALESLALTPYDIIVLDWNLPKMSGLDLVRQIRHDPKLAHIPVLFLTARAALEDLVDAFAAGADDFVAKPFRAPELGARIFALLRRARRGGEA